MKLPLSWINDYTDISDISYKDYEHAMTMSGSKVEGFLDMAQDIKNVKTGKIINTEKHPDADRLTVCKVDMGEDLGEIQIVTAATNMKVDDVVPVALHKSSIFGGEKITKGKLRGVMSEGMFCSTDELGIGEPGVKASGLLILPSDTPLGRDIVEVLHLNDAVFDFEITSNRPDCLSVIGLARETAATFRRPFNVKTPKVTENGGNINDMLKVTVENSELCRRYSARVVTDVKIEPSPEWLKRRLIACGVRPICNIVDITNYVMLEYGQPMHAFDIKFVKGSEIVVRNARAGEKITTLEGVEHELTPEMLAICDSEKPIAVAGVMGGEYSGIVEDTNTIVFESAAFLGSSVRKTAQKLGMRTESSGRYEKGLDKEMVSSALARACELITELNCGKVVSGVIDIDNGEKKDIKVPFSPEKINAFLGADIPEAEMLSALNSLEFTVKDGCVIPPSFRIDIECFNDIAEEVVRIYGYDKIPSEPMTGSDFDGGLTKEQALEKTLKYKLADCGLYEIYTYSFESPKVFDMLGIKADSHLRDTVTIKNPLGLDMSIMRTTPLYGMLTTLALNENKRNKSAFLFEIAKTYRKTDAELPDEEKNLTIGMYGAGDFFTLKGAVCEALGVYGIFDADFVPCDTLDSFHPYASARIMKDGKEIGIIGQLHPTVQKNFGLHATAFAAIIYLGEVLGINAPERKYKPLNKFPASEKDFSVVVSEDVTVKEIEDTARAAAGKLMTSIELFDVYRGSQIPEGKKSVSFTFTLENFERTLTDEETNGALNNIIEAIKEKFNAELR